MTSSPPILRLRWFSYLYLMNCFHTLNNATGMSRIYFWMFIYWYCIPYIGFHCIILFLVTLPGYLDHKNVIILSKLDSKLKMLFNIKINILTVLFHRILMPQFYIIKGWKYKFFSVTFKETHTKRKKLF